MRMAARQGHSRPRDAAESGPARAGAVRQGSSLIHGWPPPGTGGMLRVGPRLRPSDQAETAMKALILALAIIGVIAVVSAAFTYAGYYDVAADDAHWGVTEGFIATARERSIARQSRE